MPQKNSSKKAVQEIRVSPLFSQWTILIFALAAIGMVISANLLQQKSQLIQSEEEHLLLQTRIVQQIIDQSLFDLNTVLKYLAAHFPQTDGHQNINSHQLGLLANAMAGVRTIAIFDRLGNALASNREELIGKNFSDREYFYAVKKNSDADILFISKPFKTSLNVFTMTVGRMIPGPSGEFAGVAVAALDPEFFIPLLQTVLYAPDMRATLTHGSGILFLIFPDKGNMAGTNLKVPGSFFSRHLESGKEAGIYWGKSAATGMERLLAARIIKPSGLNLDNTLEITVGRDPSVILGDWHRNIILYGSLYGFAVIFSALGLAFFQRRQKRQQQEIDQASQILKDQERFMRFLTDNMPGMVGYWTLELKCKYANKDYLEWFGKTQDQMQGITMQELMGETLFNKNEPFIRAALVGERQRFERTLTKADGRTGYTLAQYIPDIEGGKVLGFFALVSDVTELKIAQMELEQRVKDLDILAATDPLTGIANRRRFLSRAEEETQRAKRYNQPLTFLMLDLDHFKTINDTYGHDIGDQVLKAVATALAVVMRNTDLIGRLGGEEFGALLVQTGLDEAKPAADRLRQALHEVGISSQGEPIKITASIGLAQYSKGDDGLQGLMKRADEALYRAKQTGRDKVCCQDE